MPGRLYLWDPTAKGDEMSKFVEFLGDESGASAAEYALILALVAIAIIGGLTVLGTTINAVLSKDASSM
jgi:pilus assembly protein Flp/PilA